jgi:glycosyltransferase involved in cell wall biosynthesis
MPHSLYSTTPSLPPEALRVLLFIDSLVAGGAQRQVVETALQLSRLGHVVTVLIYRDIRELGGELAGAGVPVVLVEKRAKFDPGFLLRLYRQFRTLRPQVLHSYLFTPNLWARFIGRAARIPVVITSERNIDLPHSRWRVRLERWVYRLGDGIIVNAEAIRRVLTDVVGVPDDRIQTIYNAVDGERFATPPMERIEAVRSTIGWRQGQIVISLPGRVIPQKNHACLIRALGRLDKEKRDSLVVLFVGNLLDAHYRHSVEKVAEHVGIRRQIIFTGRQDDMAAIYALSDVVVLPSLWEGFPNVVLEAMAAARPVVASRISDNDLLIQDGMTGYLFPSDDDSALSRVLSHLIDTPLDERRALGVAAYNSIVKRFSPESLAEANLVMYKTILDRKQLALC